MSARAAGRTEPWSIEPAGLRIHVRLTPRAAHDRIDGADQGPEGPQLKARVRAVAEDGKANAALERLIADWLGVPKSAVTLVTGGKARVKSLTVAGDGPALAAKAARLLAAAA